MRGRVIDRLLLDNNLFSVDDINAFWNSCRHIVNVSDSSSAQVIDISVGNDVIVIDSLYVGRTVEADDVKVYVVENAPVAIRSCSCRFLESQFESSVLFHFEREFVVVESGAESGAGRKHVIRCRVSGSRSGPSTFPVSRESVFPYISEY